MSENLCSRNERYNEKHPYLRTCKASNLMSEGIYLGKYHRHWEVDTFYQVLRLPLCFHDSSRLHNDNTVDFKN